MRVTHVGTAPGVIVLAHVLEKRLPGVGLVAVIDGVQPHRYCEREGVPANATPLLRGEWRLRAANEERSDDGKKAAQ